MDNSGAVIVHPNPSFEISAMNELLEPEATSKP